MHHKFTKLFKQNLVIAQIILLISFQHVIVINERGNSDNARRIYHFSLIIAVVLINALYAQGVTLSTCILQYNLCEYCELYSFVIICIM